MTERRYSDVLTDEYFDRLVVNAPELTAEQARRLGELLAPVESFERAAS